MSSIFGNQSSSRNFVTLDTYQEITGEKRFLADISTFNTQVDGVATFLNPIDGDITGNADTATTASSVPYSGLTGVVPTWNQSTTGNADTATTASSVPYSGLTGVVPTWNQSTTGNALTATTSVNLAVGQSGNIPYQSAAGTTLFTTTGDAGQILKSNAGGAPTWTTNIIGNSASSSAVSTTTDNTPGNYYLPFSKTAATGAAVSLFVDDVNGPLSYNPSTATLSSNGYTVGGRTQSIGGSTGIIQYDPVIPTQLHIRNNAAAGTLSFELNLNGLGTLLPALTLQNSGGAHFFGPSNYGGYSVNGCAKVQSQATASFAAGLTIQNTAGNAGDLIITQNQNSYDVVIQTITSSASGEILFSPKQVAAVIISATGVASFVNSIILPVGIPTNTVNQLGYNQIKAANIVPGTAIATGVHQNLIAGGFSLTPGIYTVDFQVQNSITGATAGTITSLFTGLSTSLSSFVGGLAGYALGCTSIPAIAGFISGNFSGFLVVSATTTYYFAERLVYAGIVPSHSAVGNTYASIVRIG